MREEEEEEQEICRKPYKKAELIRCPEGKTKVRQEVLLKHMAAYHEVDRSKMSTEVQGGCC